MTEGNGKGDSGAFAAVMTNGNGHARPLRLAEQFAEKKLVVIGGTGFLGKVFWALLLSRYPRIGRLYLLVRPRAGQTAEERFWADIATSEVLKPLREQFGSGFELFLKDKIVPVSGDVVRPYCGLDPELRDELRGEVDCVVNASGVIDFDPPLDLALQVNAFGVQNLVALARDLGDVPLMHTSTCFVAGERTGFIEEIDPREHPFPRSGELETAHWDPDREIAECLDIIEQARHRAGDAFRQSRFLDEAKRNLAARNEPSSGDVLDGELERVRRKYVEARLAETGTERAQFWGWPNTYTYTKSIGEQIVARSGLRFTIVRPAVVESSVSFPFPSWNEGINTSAPLLYSMMNGQPQIPGSENFLDVIPVDMVAVGMVLSLGELLEGTAPAVYQYGTSDSNPCRMSRFFELCGLYKRKYYKRTGKGGPLASFFHSHFESTLLDEKAFTQYGPSFLADGASKLSRVLRRAAVGPAAPFLKPSAKALDGFANQQRKVGQVLDNFLPFIARYRYIFRCDNTRRAFARLGADDAEKISWAPESIDWRQWFLDIHMPALEKWVFPEIDKRVRRERKAPLRHETLPVLLDQMAERFDLAIALQYTESEGLSRITFKEWRERSLACARRLRALGIQPGDRVMLAGDNHPSWPIAFFGILYAGATAVPVDAKIDADAARNLTRASRAKVFLADDGVRERLVDRLDQPIEWLDLHSAAEPGTLAEPGPVLERDVAALIYTSGTTGTPKGVMLSHYNVTSLVASLAPLFPLHRNDRVLSVLPLHHTFELTCGLLLPLSRGARVVYIDELSAERLEHGLKAGRITAMVGVPALWEMLERRIHARVAERGAVAARFFDVAMELNRTLGSRLGVDAGRVLFGPVHEALGGHLRYLVSGGAALPESTHRVFGALGLHLTEGYGLTEAAPVLSVASAGPRSRPGHVGRPVPGVEIRIGEPNGEGVGEVLARGPNVMLGYSDDESETRRIIDAEGWLHTGDLGKLDKRGNLVIVGRAKDTIVTSSGENVYPDDVEARLGNLDDVAEYVIVGASDHRGGERVACVVVPMENDALSRPERHARCKASLERKIAELPPPMRPAITTVIDVPLPRTPTRKVKRAEVRRLVERVTSMKTAEVPLSEAEQSDGAARIVRAAVAAISRREPSSISAGMTLRGDLGFDSLMLLELLVALENQITAPVDAERMAACETVGAVEALLRDSSAARRLGRSANIEKAGPEEDSSLELPPALREAAMHWLGQAQMGFYRKVMRTTVSGRAFIPQNRNVLVAANHASHLDMGLVKFALGEYGQDMVSLAAQDYFFEGGKWRKAYFENLTNLVPLSRTGSLRQSLRRAGTLLDEGQVVLIFPEGTRTEDGSIQEFKAAVGHLALQHRVDILPVHLSGTFEALPKASTLPKGRALRVRIGPVLEYEELRRLTEKMTMSDASRAVARLARRAVVELGKGRLLDTKALSPDDLLHADTVEDMADLFRELEARFVAGSVKDPISFYFALGKTERWTVEVTEDRCRVMPGKVYDVVDCVLKTSPQMFTRIVREAYTPSPSEFISGTIKSNNVQLLMTFQKVFQLTSEGN